MDLTDEKMPEMGMSVQTPPPLNKPEICVEHKFTLTALEESDERFKKISIDFENASMKVSKVEMLTNEHLWKRYSTEKDLLLEQRKTDPGFQLNEKYLYHGTSVKKSYICDEGLDSRMSNQGCFGKGIYFSDYPRKCVKYADKGKTDESYVLLVRVILGVPKVFPRGKKARMLKREPEKEEPYTGHRFYDSVEGCPVNHKEFVVYESRRALVEGIITFTKEKKAKKIEVVEDIEDLSEASNEEIYVSASENTDEDISSDSEISSDEDEDEDKKSEGDDSSHESDSGSSSDEESPNQEITKEAIEGILADKRDKFRLATGLTDEFQIDRYLLRGNMDVKAAIQIHQELKSEGLPDVEMTPEEVPVAQDHPLPNSAGWNKLSEEERKLFMERQVDDFIVITGIDSSQRDFALKYLKTVNMDLDQAVLAYYKGLSDDS